MDGTFNKVRASGDKAIVIISGSLQEKILLNEF